MHHTYKISSIIVKLLYWITGVYDCLVKWAFHNNILVMFWL